MLCSSESKCRYDEMLVCRSVDVSVGLYVNLTKSRYVIISIHRSTIDVSELSVCRSVDISVHQCEELAVVCRHVETSVCQNLDILKCRYNKTSMSCRFSDVQKCQHINHVNLSQCRHFVRSISCNLGMPELQNDNSWICWNVGMSKCWSICPNVDNI